jgi:NAD dependent epimerase/dehydratase family enzyme
LTKTLGGALRRPTFLPPVPGSLLKLTLGEFAQVFLEGQCAVPARLLDLGFVFRFPTLKEALKDLVEYRPSRGRP